MAVDPAGRAHHDGSDAAVVLVDITKIDWRAPQVALLPQLHPVTYWQKRLLDKSLKKPQRRWPSVRLSVQVLLPLLVQAQCNKAQTLVLALMMKLSKNL